jgi:hypothetical protein
MSQSTAIRFIRRLGCAAGIGLAIGVTAAPAAADPNVNSCGMGSTEAHEFQAQGQSPGASAIRNYPPGEFGCTGPKSPKA